jgi:hypothetical protein
MYLPDPDNPGGYIATTIRSGDRVAPGAQSATGVNTMNTPTAQTRSRGEMAETVHKGIPEVEAEIDAAAAKLGPWQGRLNEAIVNGYGADDPQFAGLDETLKALASRIVVAHFGGRGGQQYIASVQKDLGEAQSPADLKARINAWDRKMGDYAAAAGVHTSPTAGNNDPLGIR